MHRDLEDAKEARKRSKRTKVFGTILAILIVTVFVWSFITMFSNIAREIAGTDGETPGMEKILADLGQQQAVEQFQMGARRVAAEQFRETTERLQNDPEFRAMVDRIWQETVLPSLREEIQQQSPKLAAAFEKEADAWLEIMRTRVASNVQDELAMIVAEQTDRLAREADLTEAELDRAIKQINSIAQQAVEEMVAERMEDWEDELDAIEAARSTILAETPEDIAYYDPVKVLAKLVAYKLMELEVKGETEITVTP
jgi:hypothetical protein